MIATNNNLAVSLGIDTTWLQSADATAVFSGNIVPLGANPLAQVYAGHQFGGWSPQLGDGRAIMLGEVLDQQGKRRDIQLKGSGRTPYSRGGDGRAWLGPVLREYIISEAMHALGVPTTRALAAIATGETVQRETALPGAVLTRVAASHVRVGTFQYFAARQDTEALQILCDYVINRHYPDAESPLDLLYAVMENQALLIAKWMSVGFIHGVMNTDNMAISGETIDYGPCAFMDTYHRDTVFSSIDRYGRYAYNKQPEIAVWNLAQFASCLLPLMGEEKHAIELATNAVHSFPDRYAVHWLTIFRRKIGLKTEHDGDKELIEHFLTGLTQSKTDFTNGFRALLQRNLPKEMQDWQADWQTRLEFESGDIDATMAAVNPIYIPRNHLIEKMIQSAVSGDYAPFFDFSAVLSDPFTQQTGKAIYSEPPMPEEVVRNTFCGT